MYIQLLPCFISLIIENKKVKKVAPLTKNFLFFGDMSFDTDTLTGATVPLYMNINANSHLPST